MSATPMTWIKSVPTPSDPTNEELGLRFAHDASIFANAAKSLSDFRTFGPRYYLFCHAIELILKSYILSSGGDESELRKKIGHSLIKAFARAKKLGFVPAEKDLELFVKWLDRYHRYHEFRYPKRGVKRVPTAEDLIPVIEGTYKQVEAIATASYLKANPPPAS
jgi:hypothetical protein